jgi:hypothetical protein
MGDLATLARRIEKYEKNLPKNVSKLVVDVAMKVVEQLVSSPPEGTPVDTSKAESNWQVAIGRRPGTYLPAHILGAKGSTQGASAAVVMADALAALAGRKAGQVIYISNVAPYIRKLAYEGHSKQSPPGWVEAAVMNAERFVRKLPGGRLLNG